MRYGYIRPIVGDRQGTQQLLNIEITQVFKETHGLAKKREELEHLFMKIQQGDELYVQSIEVLADSFHQLLDILRLAERDHLVIHFLEEDMTNQTLQENSLLHWTTFFTELQSTFLSHSSTFTLQDAKRRGKSIGRPRKSDENLQRAFTMYESKKYTLYDIKEATGISKSTLYRYLDSRSTSISDGDK